MFLTGAPFTVAVIQIPLRFQAVNGLSPLQSGIRLLPFAILSPIGSGIAAGVTGKMKIPPVHVMLVGSAVQIVGFTLLSFSSTTSNISNAQYGYEAIAGFAVGINIACLIVMTPFLVEERDKCKFIQDRVKQDTDAVSSRSHERCYPVPHYGWCYRSGNSHQCVQQLSQVSSCRFPISYTIERRVTDHASLRLAALGCSRTYKDSLRPWL